MNEQRLPANFEILISALNCLDDGVHLSSHSIGGQGGVVFMGLHHPRYRSRRVSLTYCHLVNAYTLGVRFP
jgi:hypothetical protein